MRRAWWPAAGVTEYDPPIELFGGALCRAGRQTGQETGYQQTGSMTLALNPERLEELKRQATMANAFGVKCEVIDESFVQPSGRGFKPTNCSEAFICQAKPIPLIPSASQGSALEWCANF